MAFRVYTSLRDSRFPKRLVVCLGNFDGVHRGHRKVFDRAIREARRNNAVAAAVSFDPHPARVLRPARAPLQLTTLKQKVSLFEDAGLDCAIVLRFTPALATLSPAQFAERILAGRLGVLGVLVGSNFRFGRKHAGTPETLKLLGEQLGFSVGTVPPVRVGGKSISSTRIRELLAAGDVTAAAHLLGRPYSLTGYVVRGSGRGARLGFRTLNLTPEQECLPEFGVYFTEARVGSRTYRSITNIGVRPTFGGGRVLVECHLLRGAAPRRTARIEVALLKRLRDEQRFENPEALRGQIARDVAAARRYFTARARRG